MKILLFSFLLICFAAGTIHSQVSQEWAARTNGTGNLTDVANAVTTDNDGNVYVTGRSWGGASGYDILTVKCSPSGTQIWAKTYNGTGNSDDEGYALAADKEGNVYLTGYSIGSGTLRDFVTIKYAPDGSEIWVNRYDGGFTDLAHSIALDVSGNVYVTGESVSPISNYDYLTIKYSSAGVQLWTRRYNGTGNAADVAQVVMVGNSGNIYVTGYSIGPGSPVSIVLYDYATLKYNPSGQLQWVQRYNGTGRGQDLALGMVLDNSENVIVTGMSLGTGTSNDFATVKYDALGVQKWVQRYNGAASGDDRAFSIAADKQGNVCVTGVTQGILTSQDFTTVKYNAAGGEEWVQFYNGPVNGNDIARSVKVDTYSNIYVTGESFSLSSGYDYATLKYSSSGSQLWLRRFNGSGNGYDLARGLSLGPCSEVYVTGQSFGLGSNFDYGTVKYRQCLVYVDAGNDRTIFLGYGTQTAELTASASCGTVPYTYLWSDGETSQTITASPVLSTAYIVTVTDAAGCVGTDTVVANVIDVTCEPTNHKVLVCHRGLTLCVDSSAVLSHLNHGDKLGSCSEVISVPPSASKLYLNYPNPFNPVTSIRFDLVQDANISLVVYDLVGRQIAVLAAGYFRAGNHNAEWNAADSPSGAYFYRLTANGTVIDTKKMILVK